MGIMNDSTNAPNTNPKPSDESRGDNSQDASAADLLINSLINSDAVFFHDERNEPYMAPEGNGGQLFRLESKEFSDWLHYYYWETTGGGSLPQNTDTKTAHTLSAYALYKGSKHELRVRLAKNKTALWYDLGEGKAVYINSQGWQVTDVMPFLFRRFRHQEAQVEPQPNGDIEQLRAYINVTEDHDDDWLLFLVNLVAAFVPGFPHPLLILYGPEGAGKTTPMRIMKKLIDPSAIEGLPLLSPGQDFMQVADHHAFLFFDNLSNMPTNISDALARASTGDGFSKRRHFTNDDDFVYKIQLPIAINGINQVVSKADLLDRAILIKLQRISLERRTSEEELWEAFDGSKPSILGAIFDILSRALQLRPTITLDNTPRMADFARWGCAIAEAAGYPKEQFLDAYYRNISLQTEWAIEASPVAQAIIEMMNNREKWEGTATMLLNDLGNIAFDLQIRESRYWPKESVHMGRKINELQATLAKVGIYVEHVKTSKDRLIVITKDPEVTADTVLPPVEEQASFPNNDSQDENDTKTVETVNPWG